MATAHTPLVDRLCDPSRCPGCTGPTEESELAAGGSIPCRGCGGWVLDTGLLLLPTCSPAAKPTLVRHSCPLWSRVLPSATPAAPPLPAPPEPRLVFDDATRTIKLDGAADTEPLSPDVYHFLKALGDGERCGSRIPGVQIRQGPGLKSARLDQLIKKLPRRWRRLVKSKNGWGGGYCLTLPATK